MSFVPKLHTPALENIHDFSTNPRKIEQRSGRGVLREADFRGEIRGLAGLRDPAIPRGVGSWDRFGSENVLINAEGTPWSSVISAP